MFNIAPVFIGNLLVGIIGDNLLVTNLLAEMVDEEFLYLDFSVARGLAGEFTVDTVMQIHEVFLAPLTILIFLGVGIGTTFLSVIMPVCYLMRFDPKKLMM